MSEPRIGGYFQAAGPKRPTAAEVERETASLIPMVNCKGVRINSSKSNEPYFLSLGYWRITPESKKQ